MNAARGLVTLTGDDGRDYVLSFSLNAMCAVEEALGAPLMELQAQLDAPSATDLRGLLWALLRDHHPDVTLQDAGRIAAVSKVAEAVTRAIAAAQPEAANGKPRPRKASASIR